MAQTEVETNLPPSIQTPINVLQIAFQEIARTHQLRAAELATRANVLRLDQDPNAEAVELAAAAEEARVNLVLGRMREDLEIFEPAGVDMNPPGFARALRDNLAEAETHPKKHHQRAGAKWPTAEFIEAERGFQEVLKGDLELYRQGRVQRGLTIRGARIIYAAFAFNDTRDSFAFPTKADRRRFVFADIYVEISSLDPNEGKTRRNSVETQFVTISKEVRQLLPQVVLAPETASDRISKVAAWFRAQPEYRGMLGQELLAVFDRNTTPEDLRQRVENTNVEAKKALSHPSPFVSIEATIKGVTYRINGPKAELIAFLKDQPSWVPEEDVHLHLVKKGGKDVEVTTQLALARKAISEKPRKPKHLLRINPGNGNIFLRWSDAGENIKIVVIPPENMEPAASGTVIVTPTPPSMRVDGRARRVVGLSSPVEADGAILEAVAVAVEPAPPSEDPPIPALPEIIPVDGRTDAFEVAGKKVLIGGRELRGLLYLAQRAGQVITADRLARELPGARLTDLAGRLRPKLGDALIFDRGSNTISLAARVRGVELIPIGPATPDTPPLPPPPDARYHPDQKLSTRQLFLLAELVERAGASNNTSVGVGLQSGDLNKLRLHINGLQVEVTEQPDPNDQKIVEQALLALVSSRENRAAIFKAHSTSPVAQFLFSKLRFMSSEDQVRSLFSLRAK